MNKLVIGFAIVLIILIGVGFGARSAEPGDLLYPLRPYFSGDVSYVVDVSGEVALLEEELAGIEDALASGAMTEAEAIEARERIIARVDRISASVEDAERAELTPAQRAQLRGALSQLTNILTTYRDSLESLDEVAGISTSTETASGDRLNPRGGRVGTRSLRAIIADAADQLLEHIEETVGEPIDSALEDILEEIMDEEETVPSDDEEMTDEESADEDSDAEADEVLPDETEGEMDGDTATSGSMTDESTTTSEETATTTQ